VLTIAARARRRTTLAALAAIFAVLVFPLATRHLEDWSRALLWRGFHVVAARNSVYGNLVVARTEDSASLYENGLVLFDAPNREAAEEAVHFALLEHPEPRSLLLIGGGANGSLAQALQHPSLERLDYVELDPAIAELAARYFPREWAPALTDRRVHVHASDGRLFLKSAGATFDVVIVNLPDPDTAQLNRFYTLEFFREARRSLRPGGILSLHVGASENYISPPAAEFLRCIYKTLREAFPEVVAIPATPCTLRYHASGHPDDGPVGAARAAAVAAFAHRLRLRVLPAVPPGQRARGPARVRHPPSAGHAAESRLRADRLLLRRHAVEHALSRPVPAAVRGPGAGAVRSAGGRHGIARRGRGNHRAPLAKKAQRARVSAGFSVATMGLTLIGWRFCCCLRFRQSTDTCTTSSPSSSPVS